MMRIAFFLILIGGIISCSENKDHLKGWSCDEIAVVCCDHFPTV